MSIYTRTGDKGKTSLFSGQRVSKADLRIEVCGTIDELNSTLGVVLSIRYLALSIRKELIKIQKDLLEIGSILANPNPKYSIQNTKYFLIRVKEFEKLIDEMAESLPPLKNFILPGGGKTGARLHLSRAVCRRLERGIVELNERQKTDSSIIIYFNRLSDLLFTMARFANFKEKKKDKVWEKKQG
jgi:cob(I)alamin adenosyltransferase